MPKKFEYKTLVIASHNQGKIREIGALLKPFAIEVVAGNAELSEPEETAPDFRGNAEIKAEFFCNEMGLPALSDDSGLCVPALNDAPGIYSARWAGPSKDFNMAMKKISDELLKKTGTDKNHEAYFVCALCLCFPDGHKEHFEGRVDGSLTFPPRGSNGFGYDPIFVPEGYTATFGEMKPEAKHEMSHRARACQKLVDACFA